MWHVKWNSSLTKYFAYVNIDILSKWVVLIDVGYCYLWSLKVYLYFNCGSFTSAPINVLRPSVSLSIIVLCNIQVQAREREGERAELYDYCQSVNLCIV